MHVLRHLRKWTIVLSLLLLLGLVTAPVVRAFDLREGDRLVIGPNEVVNDDLYAAGQSITIDGTIQGDAVLAGSIITVNGTINGDLIAAAQTIVIHGTVRDNARLAAQAVLIDSPARIGRDLITFAYSLETRPGSVIGRDVGVGAYQALLAGNVDRNLRGGMAGLELRGTTGGDVEVSLGDSANGGGQFMTSPPPAIALPSVPTGLAMAESARIEGKLTYTARQQVPLAGQIGRGVTYQAIPVEQEAPGGVGAFLADQARRLLALGLVGLLLLWLVPGWIRRLANTVEMRPGPSFGWGLVAALAAFGAAIGLGIATGFVAAALGASTLFGLMALAIVLGLLGEATLITGMIAFTSYVAQAIASYLGGRFLLERVQPTWNSHRVVPFLVGLVIFVALTAIPVLGWIVGFVVAIVGLGAAWIWVGETLRPAPSAAGPLPTVEPADHAIAA